MRIVIAEDEDPQRAELSRMVRARWPEAEVVETSDGHGALDALEAEETQVAFLDIRMPGLDGLRVAELAPAETQVVFVTAHAEPAVAAFERGAIDYLLKPVLRERFDTTAKRLDQRLASGREDLKALLEGLRVALDEPRCELSWVTASVGETVQLFSIDEVLAFHARDKYTEVITADADATIRMSLRELRAQLDERIFWPVHRSVLVRASAIHSIHKDGGGRFELRLKGRDLSLPVSASFRRTLRPM